MYISVQDLLFNATSTHLLTSRFLNNKTVHYPRQHHPRLSKMVAFSSLFLAASAAAMAVAAPSEQPGMSLKRQTLTSSATGTNNGFYFSFWTDGAGTISYTNKAAGEYAVTWSGNAGNWVGGKGWNPGAAR